MPEVSSSVLFLKKMTNDEAMESMVQRVVSQVCQANLTADITFATNANQLYIIINHLGDQVSVVTEPERRDTFPAIAFVASYLSLAKNCPDDEVVVIMPCALYTEIGYFETHRPHGRVHTARCNLTRAYRHHPNLPKRKVRISSAKRSCKQ